MARYSKGKLFWAIREQLKPADLPTLHSLLAADRRLGPKEVQSRASAAGRSA